jgi:hypothetical protein
MTKGRTGNGRLHAGHHRRCTRLHAHSGWVRAAPRGIGAHDGLWESIVGGQEPRVMLLHQPSIVLVRPEQVLEVGIEAPPGSLWRGKDRGKGPTPDGIKEQEKPPPDRTREQEKLPIDRIKEHEKAGTRWHRVRAILGQPGLPRAWVEASRGPLRGVVTWT